MIGGLLLGIGSYANAQKSEYYQHYREFYDFISDPTIAVITVACLTIVVSGIGMIGALRDNIKLLYLVRILSGDDPAFWLTDPMV